MALLELSRKAELEEDVDFLRDGMRAMAQQLMELEVMQHLGANKYERRLMRTAERNGNRDRQWDTRVGNIELRVRVFVVVTITRRCWSHVAAANARWWQWSRGLKATVASVLQGAQLAALPHASDEKCAGTGAQRSTANGRRHHLHGPLTPGRRECAIDVEKSG
jgi:hypothetical protein